MWRTGPPRSIVERQRRFLLQVCPLLVLPIAEFKSNVPGNGMMSYLRPLVRVSHIHELVLWGISFGWWLRDFNDHNSKTIPKNPGVSKRYWAEQRQLVKWVRILKVLLKGVEKSCHRRSKDQAEEVRMTPVGDEEWVGAVDWVRVETVFAPTAAKKLLMSGVFPALN
jgi:hypothetical protein